MASLIVRRERHYRFGPTVQRGVAARVSLLAHSDTFAALWRVAIP
jgi:hypothetical protein